MATVGVDIGTSGCKAVLVKADGSILNEAYREYSYVATTDGGQELDSELVIAAAKAVIATVAANCCDEAITAISASSLGESVIAIDRSGAMINRAMLYSDPRGADVETQLERRVEREAFFEKTGYFPSRVSSACRIMWLKKHRPEVYERAVLFLPFNALLLVSLGARPHIDHTLASTTMLFDIWNKCWDAELLRAADIPQALLPEPVTPGSIVGTIHSSMAKLLGLPECTVLVAGGHDQQCVSLGAGVTEPGDVLDGMGSVEAIGVVVEEKPNLGLLSRYRLSIEPHLLPGKYSVYGCTMTAGRCVKWFRDCFCKDIVQVAQEQGRDAFDLMLNTIPAEINQILWVPYFSGAGTPFNDPGAQSLLFGVDLETDRGALLRGLLEGIAFEAEINLECLIAAGIPMKTIYAVGGLAKSERYLQIKADIMGRNIITLQANQAGALGAAILAQYASGAYASLAEAASRMVSQKSEICSQPLIHTAYQKKYSAYKQIHPQYKKLDIRLEG